jgi:NAD(P)H-dependent FMN reductase
MLAKETNRKRALGIVGSPRRGGNTEILVDEVLRGAEEAGAQVEKVILSELDIAPCQACDHCASTGECAQRDDMPALLERMRCSQVWVLGTPVYFGGPTAQFKAFLDRWYGAKQMAFVGQRAILVVPMGEPDESYADCVLESLRAALAYLEVEPFAAVVAPGIWELGEVCKCTAILATAHRLGREAVESDLSRAQEDVGEAEPPFSEPDAPGEATIWISDLFTMVGPRLVITGAPIPLPQKQEMLIGRAKPGVTPVPDIDLAVHGGDQAGVSRHHARMSRGLGGWMLEDLNSTNGTFINGKQVLPGQQVSVHTGDVIRFGTLMVIFYE